MVEDDVLLRQIATIARAVARWMRGDTPADERLADINRSSTRLFGLDLGTLQRIPAGRLPHLLPVEAPGGATRWVLAARVLIVAARDEPPEVRPQRAAKALAFIEAALQSGVPLDPPTLEATLAELEALGSSAS